MIYGAQVGVVTYDASYHFYNLKSSLSEPQAYRHSQKSPL